MAFKQQMWQLAVLVERVRQPPLGNEACASACGPVGFALRCQHGGVTPALSLAASTSPAVAGWQPCTPAKHLPKLWHALLAQELPREMCTLNLHQAQHIARQACLLGPLISANRGLDGVRDHRVAKRPSQHSVSRAIQRQWWRACCWIPWR